jgi:hypothetical protein
MGRQADSGTYEITADRSSLVSLFSRSTRTDSTDDRPCCACAIVVFELPTIPPGLVSARGNPSWTQLLSPQSFPRHLATFMPLHHIGVYASYRTIENAGSTPNVYETATYT